MAPLVDDQDLLVTAGFDGLESQDQAGDFAAAEAKAKLGRAIGWTEFQLDTTAGVGADNCRADRPPRVTAPPSGEAAVKGFPAHMRTSGGFFDAEPVRTDPPS